MAKTRKTQGADGPFQKLEAKVAKEPGVTDPAAVAAAAGRKSLGQAEMTRRSVAGRKAAAHDYTPDTPSTFPSRPDTNARVPNALSDASPLKAPSFGGVSLADFGYGRDTKFTFDPPEPVGAPSVMSFGAPYGWSGNYPGLEPKQVAGGLKASGFGSSGINGKDASFSNDSVSGTDKISKLWN